METQKVQLGIIIPLQKGENGGIEKLTYPRLCCPLFSGYIEVIYLLPLCIAFIQNLITSCFLIVLTTSIVISTQVSDYPFENANTII